jgi:hypothetical protein
LGGVSVLLTQREADDLLSFDKHYRGNEVFTFPLCGGALEIPLYSSNNREAFIFDISRGKISLKKKFQTRARIAVVLVRVDIGGAPHRNPDGEEIPSPHIHLYKANFDDRWAYPLSDYFENIDDTIKILDEFMGYCKIITKPNIQKELFYD